MLTQRRRRDGDPAKLTGAGVAADAEDAVAAGRADGAAAGSSEAAVLPAGAEGALIGQELAPASTALVPGKGPPRTPTRNSESQLGDVKEDSKEFGTPGNPNLDPAIHNNSMSQPNGSEERTQVKGSGMKAIEGQVPPQGPPVEYGPGLDLAAKTLLPLTDFGSSVLHTVSWSALVWNQGPVVELTQGLCELALPCSVTSIPGQRGEALRDVSF